jgi:hypothetical protein
MGSRSSTSRDLKVEAITPLRGNSVAVGAIGSWQLEGLSPIDEREAPAFSKFATPQLSTFASRAISDGEATHPMQDSVVERAPRLGRARDAATEDRRMKLVAPAARPSETSEAARAARACSRAHAHRVGEGHVENLLGSPCDVERTTVVARHSKTICEDAGGPTHSRLAI